MAIKINAKEHKVSTVSVFQTNTAVVQRLFSVELQAGQNEINIVRLPSVLMGDSIRVEARSPSSSSQHLTVFDVIHIPATYSYGSVSYEPGSALDTLYEAKKTLISRQAILKKQGQVLEGYSDSVKPVASEGGVFPPAHLESFLDIYGTRQAQINEETRSVEREITKTQKDIEALEKELRLEKEEQNSTSITVIMLAEEEGSAELLLTYMVSQASWTSLYDIRADITPAGDKGAATPDVKLQYSANIKQTTGEDWDGVELTLSTATPRTSSSIPKLTPSHVRPVPKEKEKVLYKSRARKSAAPAGASRFLAASASEESDDDMGFAIFDEGELVPASAPAITVRQGAVSSTYTVAGLSTITSDQAWHRVSIATLDLAAELEWVTVPRELTSTFLQCRIRNSSTFELIGGPGSVFMDGNFVAKTTVPNVSPQESFLCSLGVDPSVRITYHPQKKTSTTIGNIMSGKSNVTTFRQRITIKNTRAASISRLVVQDRVPLSEDSRIKVVTLSPPEKAIGPTSSSGSGTVSAAGVTNQTLIAQVAKDIVARWAQKSDEKGGSGGSRQDGILEWICTDLLDTVDLELVYEISAPLDLEWTNA